MTEVRVTATPEALRAIEKLKEEIGPIMFYQSGGCNDESLPMCFKLEEFIIGKKDVLLGRIDDTPVYIDKRHYLAWEDSLLILDVAPGEPNGFSIAAADKLHFVSRSRKLKLDISLE